MHDESFDRMIRDRLKGLSVDYNEKDWEALQDMLNVSGPEHNISISDLHAELGQVNGMSGEDSFNQLISQKLQNYTVHGDIEQDWFYLASKLYGPFDASVDYALGKYEVPYDPADWQAMVAYIDSPFYDQIRQKLSNHNVSGATTDWKFMKARLESGTASQKPARAFAWYPYAIAASLALLIMLWLPQSGIISEVGGPSGESMTMRNLNENEENLTGEIIIPANKALVNDTIVDSSRQAKRTLRLENNIADALSNLDEASSTHKKPQKQILVDISSIDASEKIHHHLGLDEELSGFPDRKESESETQTDESDAAAESERVVRKLDQYENLADDNSDTYNQSPYTQLPLIRPVSKKIDTALLEESSIRPYEYIGFHNMNQGLDPEFWIGFYSGSASSMAELNDPAELGFVGGMRVELKFNDMLSLVSGINYAEKSYTNEFNTRQTADNAAGFTRVQQVLEARFSMIEIPALVRLKVPSEEQHSFYVQAGIVPFIMLQEDYNNYNPNSPSNIDRSSSSIAGFGFDPKEQYESTSHNLSFQTYVANLYTAIGWEYELNTNLMLQVEPFFQMGLQSMGPPGSDAAEQKKLYTGGIAASFIFNSASGKKKRKK